MRPNLIAGTGVAALAALLGAGLPSMDAEGGYSGLSPRFLPTVVTIALAACAVLLLVRRDSVPAPADAGSGPREAAVARLTTLVAGLLLHMALVGTVGFVAAGTLLMALVARGYGSRRPVRDLLVGLALTGPLWVVFTKLLGLALPLVPVLGI